MILYEYSLALFAFFLYAICEQKTNCNKTKIYLNVVSFLLLIYILIYPIYFCYTNNILSPFSVMTTLSEKVSKLSYIEKCLFFISLISFFSCWLAIAFEKNTEEYV